MSIKKQQAKFKAANTGNHSEISLDCGYDSFKSSSSLSS